MLDQAPALALLFLALSSGLGRAAVADDLPPPVTGAAAVLLADAPLSPTGAAEPDASEPAPNESDMPISPTATGVLGAFARVASFFFKQEGPDQRTWGFVPLIVADSNAGFGAGVKFVENDLFGSKIRVDAITDYTSNQFFEFEAAFAGPKIFDVVSWNTDTYYRSRPRLFYWGIGNNTTQSGRGSLWLEETVVEARPGWESSKNLTIFSVFRFSNVNAFNGPQNHSIPPVTERFGPAELVGFGARPYTNAVGLLGEYDVLDNRFNPTIGARLQLAGLYHGPEIGDAPFRYGYYWVDLAAYAPVIEQRLTLAVHTRVDLIDSGVESAPFYGLPLLGGTTTLRGYLIGRIRDRQSILFQAELRFPIWRVISGATFFDAGRVYQNFFKNPEFNHLYTDAGLGIRFVLQPDIVVRLDLAVGEGLLFALDFGYPF
jgi:hypothetical protein